MGRRCGRHARTERECPATTTATTPFSASGDPSFGYTPATMHPRGSFFALWPPRPPLLLLLLLGGAAAAPLPARGDCLAAMAAAADWAPCRTGGAPCWAFLSEQPLVTILPAPSAAAAATRRRLFPCSAAGRLGVVGDIFALLPVLGDDGTSAASAAAATAQTHWCMYADNATECTFDELLSYIDAAGTADGHPAFGAALGFLGVLLSTPERAGQGFWLETMYRVGPIGEGWGWVTRGEGRPEG